MTLAYPISLSITAFLLVVAGGGYLFWRQSNDLAAWCAAFILCAIGAAGLHYATWRADIDEAGIHVSAPLSVFRRGGTAAWADILNLDVRHRRRSIAIDPGSGETLSVVTRTGRLTIPIGDMNATEAERLVTEIGRRSPVLRQRGGKALPLPFGMRMTDGFKLALLRLEGDSAPGADPGFAAPARTEP